jgi:peptidoglycan/xylan/chitin deacetylase (PgdA/CDA1 family)
MLHRVLDDAPVAFDLPSCYRMRGTALTVAELVRVIEEAGHILPLDAVEHAVDRGEEPPAGSVLTFDDGYREHLDVVAPLLAARGVSATFYVATGLHGEGSNVAVVDAWYWLLDHAAEGVARVPLPGGGAYRGRIDTYESKGAWVGGEPKAALLAATVAQQAVMLQGLAASTGCTPPSDLAARLYLRPSEWSSLVGLGMRVGAHSIRHPRLTQLEDDRLQTEIAGSVDAVRRLGGPVTFAYPDGAYEERVVHEVRRAAVSSSVTCEPGTVGRGADLMRLPRVFVAAPRARG